MAQTTEKTKVTSDVLREMKMGETLTFALPDAAAVLTGKSLAYRMGRLLRCKFSAPADFDNNRLTITKSPLSHD